MSTGRTALSIKDRCRRIAARPAAAMGSLKGGYDNLPLAAKLWLGFGMVFGVVGALGVFVALSINRLEDILSHATTVAEPLSAAAYEMEINAIGSGMGVMTYLHTPDAAFVARFNEDQKEFEAFQRTYDSVAPSTHARELGQRAAQTYAAYRSLGASLIAAKDREVETLKRLASAVGDLDRALEEGTAKLAERNVPATARLLSQVRAELSGFSFWLTLQLEATGSGDPEALRQRAVETRSRLGELVSHLADSAVLDRPSRLGASFEQIFELIDEILAITQFIGKNVRAFSELRSRLDEILDEEVQIFAREEILDTQWRANQKSRELRFWLLASGALVLLLAAVSVLVIAKGILEPVRALADGTQALASGQLGHRVRIASGDEIGQLAAAFDQMAARLQTAAETLEAEIQRRTADLSEAKSSLEEELARRIEVEKQLLQAQKMESVGSLAGGIAHDFNNMLYVILGSTQLASDSLVDDSKARAQLARALEAGKRSKVLVQKLLTFSRQEPPNLEPVNFEPVLRNALDLLRASLPPAVELREDIGEDCGTLLADAAQLEQVIVNLGVNALQAMDDGAGSIRVAARRVKINPTQAARHIGLKIGEHVSLTVRDNGCGIAPEVLPKVMDPFFTTKPPGKGTGLGLSVAQGIIASHGGTITLHSKPGRGTTAKILLPLCTPAAHSARSPGSVRAGS